MPLTLRYILNHPLNRKAKTHAVLRYLRWQIGSRMAPGEIVYRWIGDARVIVRPGETGFTQNIYCGLHDFGDMGYLLHVLSPEDLFVDIGANIGAYTILATAVRGSSAICFEPVPQTYQRLVDNLRLNGLCSSQAVNIGLADKDGELCFTSDENCTNHVAVNDDRNVVRVPVRRLDAVLAGRVPAVMKIDVEGFETPVLNGAEQTLSNPMLHSVIIELNGSGARYGFDEEAIMCRMMEFGFEPFDYDPFTRLLRRLPGKNSESNTLFIRHAAEIAHRLQQAPAVNIFAAAF